MVAGGGVAVIAGGTVVAGGGGAAAVDAGGVTSRSAGPVPPVVNTKEQPASTNSTKVALILAVSSGIKRGSKVTVFCSAAVSQLCSAGKPLSSYTPVEARSLMETMPILMGSC